MTELDDNLTLTDGGNVICTQCKTLLGNANDDPLANAVKRERPSRNAGPGVHADPKIFTTREIVLRQFFAGLQHSACDGNRPARRAFVSTLESAPKPRSCRPRTGTIRTSAAIVDYRSLPSGMCGAKYSIGDRHEKRRSVHARSAFGIKEQ